MLEEAFYYADKKFNNFPVIIIMANDAYKKKVYRNYYIKELQKVYENNIALIYSRIIPKTDCYDRQVFYVIYKYEKGSESDLTIKHISIKNNKRLSLKKIISGGQTGADQGGLIAGKSLGLYTGGYVPKDYQTENGPNTSLKVFGVQESPMCGYNPRTLANIKDSDATIIIGKLSSPGSKLTKKLAIENHKPIFLLNGKITDKIVDEFKIFLVKNKVEVLNVAGNRESVNPGIARYVYKFLCKVFSKSATEYDKLMEYKSIWLNHSEEEVERYHEKLLYDKKVKIEKMRKKRMEKYGEIDE